MINKVLTNKFTKNKLLKYTIGLIVIWTIILVALSTIDLKLLNNATNNLVMREAKAHFQKDEAFRFWSSAHGGFYVFANEQTPPNPYLEHIPECDIETPSGKKLTLMNPAYALRQMLEDYEYNYGIAGHITSLLPLRPENLPDEWERSALESFENGDTIAYEFTTLNEISHLRYMKPLITIKGCLKCHEHQGYNIGDIRGGISISVPMTSYLVEENKTANAHILSFSALWLLGVIGIKISYLINSKSNAQKQQVQILLQQSHDQLESKIKKRTDELQSEIDKHKQTVEQLNRSNQQLSANEQQLIANEKILKISEEKYRLIATNTFDTIWKTDINFNITFVNSAIFSLLGYTNEEFIGLCASTFTTPDGMESIKNAANYMLNKYKEGEIVQHKFEIKQIKKDNTIIDVELSANILQNDEGVLIGFQGRSFDITEKKRNEQIQEVLYKISNAVTATGTLENLIRKIQNVLGTIIDTSNFYVALYNSEKDMLSLPYYADDRDKFSSVPAAKTLSKYVIETKKSLLANINIKKKLVEEGKLTHKGSLSKIWLGVPLKAEGKIIGVFAVQSYKDENAFTLEDMKMLEFVSDQIGISIERKKAEEDLIEALKKANESARLKSAFLATMSHELRTPLNAIIGFSELINKDWPIDEIVEFADTINSSGNHLLSIVNDIFDITLIEAGVSKLTNHETNIITVLKETHKIIKSEQQILKKDNITLDLILKDEKELLLFTDSSKLKQILINLVKNALKFTTQGYVRYGYEVEADSNNNLFIKFFIKDTGIGISVDDKDMIFENFRQVDDSYTRTYGGTGIGLSISKKLTELLGGTIWFESKINNGSTFYFTIPYVKVNVVDKPILVRHKQNISLKNKTILIVEDDINSFELLKIVLEQQEIKILWAKKGPESIEMCRQNTSIDMVLMDINMDMMNGYIATAEIKKFRPDLPIIAQTALAMVGDQEKALKAGCDDYLAKPINKNILLDIICKWIG